MQRKKIAAFTLVELLVVLAVIALLAGLLLPAISTAKSKGVQTRCLSQLRQLHQVITLYMNDNNNEFPPAYAGTTAASSWVWYYKNSPIADYAGGAKSFQKLTVCPENASGSPLGVANGQYVNNDYGYPYVANYNIMRSMGSDPRIRSTSLAKASQTILLMDTEHGAGWGYGFSDPDDAKYKRVGSPHQGKTNVLWCDGHASAEIKDSLTAACFHP